MANEESKSKFPLAYQEEILEGFHQFEGELQRLLAKQFIQYF